MESNWYKDKKVVAPVLLVIDRTFTQLDWDKKCTLTGEENLNLKHLLYGLNELAKKGLALRAAIEEILESHTDSDIIAFDKLDKAAEVYDGKGD